MIRVKRIQIRRTANETSTRWRSFRELTRRYFANEGSWDNAIEVLLFAIIVAISTWQIWIAVDSLKYFLQLHQNFQNRNIAATQVPSWILIILILRHDQLSFSKLLWFSFRSANPSCFWRRGDPSAADEGADFASATRGGWLRACRCRDDGEPLVRSFLWLATRRERTASRFTARADSPGHGGRRIRHYRARPGLWRNPLPNGAVVSALVFS